MRYIKEYNEEKYYERISKYQFDIDITKSIEFSNSEISKIETYVNVKPKVGNHPPSTGNTIYYLYSTERSITHIMYIIKTEDEWFYLDDCRTGLFYKCDQMEGLIQLLGDISN